METNVFRRLLRVDFPLSKLTGLDLLNVAKSIRQVYRGTFSSTDCSILSFILICIGLLAVCVVVKWPGHL
jgi:hypothetical protein